MRKSINWSQYNKELVNRGRVTFWFSPEAVNSWYAAPSGKPGAQPVYSDAAIEVLFILCFRFGLRLRCVQGFAESIFQLAGIELRVPDYTTLCRRFEKLSLEIRKMVDTGKPVHVVIDSTGLKIYGEGEWKVRQHGYSKRRTWRKLHLSVDEANSQIVAVALSDNSFHDSELFDDLVDATDGEIEQISADGGYDTHGCYGKSLEEGINLVAPPQENAKIWQHGNSHSPPHPRDIHLREIREMGDKGWKEKNNYHRRSISETAMYRFKTLFGEKLSSRSFQRQANEAFVKCQMLNKMRVPACLAV